MPLLMQLFISFALIGLGAYGGGLVTIPLIQHEVVTAQHWLTFDQMAQLLAISQVTPGPIAINAATFVGVRMGGVPGAAVATLAVIMPSLFILGLGSRLMDRLGKNGHIQQLREGIQIGVLSLILFAVWSYGAGVIANGKDLALGVAAFLALVVFEGKFHPVFVLLAGGLAGLFFLG